MTIATVNTQPQSLYYRAGSGTNLKDTIVAGVCIAGCTLVAGPLFALLQRLTLMLSIKLAIVVVILAAMGLGWLVGRILYWQRIHNIPLAMGLALLGALAYLYATWTTWPVVALYTFLPVGGDEPFTLAGALEWMLPQNTVTFIQLAYENGTWTEGNNKEATKGILLGIMWALEILTSAGFIVALAWQAVTKRPFCEACQTWTVERTLLKMPVVAGVNPTALKTRLESHQFDSLTEHHTTAATSDELHIYLQGCPTCDNLQTLCVDNVSTTVNKKGAAETKTKCVIKGLNLTAEQTVAVAMVAADIKARSETTPTPAEVPATPA